MPVEASPPRRPRVLVVDDSAVARRLIVEALSAEPALEVAGTAHDGRAALERLDELRPDLVTLDIDMPALDGLGALREIRARSPRLPVVMFSALTSSGAQGTISALLAGADDFAHKPCTQGGGEAVRREIRELLVPKILALCRAASAERAAGTGALSPVRVLSDTTVFAPAPRALAPPPPCDVVAIGISTGGPAALAQLLDAVGPDLAAPLLVVQHMPAAYTAALASSLASRTGLDVREARAGDLLEAGRCLIAPGDQHLRVEPAAEGARTALDRAAPENSCRPSVDVLFRSVASVFGSGSLALVMTGMGQDGLAGARDVRARGGTVLAQDEASSVVWGMPGAVVRAGLADRVRDVAGLAREIRARMRSDGIARAL